MDIFEQIVSEHREVDGMLEKLSTGYDSMTFGELQLTLKAHMRAEERSLYPAMEKEESELVEHATREHRVIEGLLHDLDQGPKRGDDYTSLIAKLSNVIKDHVKDEEENMFSRARNLFGEDAIKRLSEKFNEVDETILEKA
jgi:hemerythrin superfamily protein